MFCIRCGTELEDNVCPVCHFRAPELTDNSPVICRSCGVPFNEFGICPGCGRRKSSVVENGQSDYDAGFFREEDGCDDYDYLPETSGKSGVLARYSSATTILTVFLAVLVCLMVSLIWLSCSGDSKPAGSGSLVSSSGISDSDKEESERTTATAAAGTDAAQTTTTTIETTTATTTTTTTTTTTATTTTTTAATTTTTATTTTSTTAAPTTTAPTTIATIRPAPGSPYDPSRNYSTGESITFGSYEQDGDLSNGNEPIEWIVLDSNDHGTLVLSYYALGYESFSNDRTEGHVWKDSVLRKWLNKDFYSSAFSSDEQNLILTTKLSNSGNSVHGTDGGEDTEDRVFVLSIDEVKEYVNHNRRITYITWHSRVNNGLTDPIHSNGCWWWLRSPGETTKKAAYVDGSGHIGTKGNWINLNLCVRPAMYLQND